MKASVSNSDPAKICAKYQSCKQDMLKNDQFLHVDSMMLA